MSKNFANPETRDRFPYFQTITTRWKDNDIYGHVNNVVYYSYVDTVANEYLIRKGVLDIENSPVIGVAVESLCEFRSPLTFPDQIDGGLRVGRVGKTSVRYEVGLFKQGEEHAAAVAYFIHVFVDRDSRKPITIEGDLRRALMDIFVE